MSEQDIVLTWLNSQLEKAHNLILAQEQAELADLAVMKSSVSSSSSSFSSSSSPSSRKASLTGGLAEFKAMGGTASVSSATWERRAENFTMSLADCELYYRLWTQVVPEVPFPFLSLSFSASSLPRVL
jgi:hypothetical protein